MTRAAIVCFLLAGCGSSADDKPTTSGPPAVFSTTGATGVYGDRSVACDRVAAALKAKASTLMCTLSPEPACPALVDQLEQSSGLPAGSCVQYDLGTVENCEQRIATYTTCADFASKGCQLGIRKCSGPTDAGVTDTSTDSASDAVSEGG